MAVLLRVTEKYIDFCFLKIILSLVLHFTVVPTIKFTYALKRFFPKLKDTAANGKTLQEVFKEIESNYPGLQSYVLDEQGSLRRHVNIFIDGKMIRDRSKLTDAFSSNSEIYIMQALSGG
jgi:hypothetical protein